MLSTKEQVREEAGTQIRELLRVNGDSPSRVGRLLDVNRGLVARVRDGGYSEIVTVALDLPVVKTTEVAICLECGHLHTQKKTCASVLKREYKIRRRKAIDLNPGGWGALQSRALDDVAKDAGFDSWTLYCTDLADRRIGAWPRERFHNVVSEVVI